MPSGFSRGYPANLFDAFFAMRGIVQEPHARGNCFKPLLRNSAGRTDVRTSFRLHRAMDAELTLCAEEVYSWIVDERDAGIRHAKINAGHVLSGISGNFVPEEHGITTGSETVSAPTVGHDPDAGWD